MTQVRTIIKDCYFWYDLYISFLYSCIKCLRFTFAFCLRKDVSYGYRFYFSCLQYEYYGFDGFGKLPITFE